jgi:ectoine hydroxylase-related dioxygenase (phytanoyl-CoA dioxygenase family)
MTQTHSTRPGAESAIDATQAADAIDAIDAATIEALWRDGVVYLPGVIDAVWQDRLRAAIDRDIADPGPFQHGYQVDGGGRFHGNMRLWENDPDFRDYCLAGPLPGLAAKLLKSSTVTLFYDQLFVKEPGTNAPTRWHNDQPYWPIRGRQVMSFWLALDPVSFDSGALEFVLGSHAWDRWFQPQKFAPGGADYEKGEGFEPIPDFDAERANYRFKGWEMQPGDLVAFMGLTVHGSKGNLTADRRRRGYTVRYCGDDARYFSGPGSNKELRNPALADGDPLASAQYPLVWPVG